VDFRSKNHAKSLPNSNFRTVAGEAGLRQAKTSKNGDSEVKKAAQEVARSRPGTGQKPARNRPGIGQKLARNGPKVIKK